MNLHDEESRQIVDLYWERSPLAIEKSQKNYGSYCHAIAYNILHNDPDSDECVNETWYRAWCAMPDARPDHLGAFLAAITRRLSIDYYRRHHAARRNFGETNLLYEELSECLADQRSDMDQHIDEMTLTEALNHFLKELDQESRVLFIKRYWYCESIREIANSLSMNQSRIKSNLFRTRKRLKKYLESEGIYI